MSACCVISKPIPTVCLRMRPVQELDQSVNETSQFTCTAILMHRSAFWLADGRWRQWEAYDCVNVGECFNCAMH